MFEAMIPKVIQQAKKKQRNEDEYKLADDHQKNIKMKGWSRCKQKEWRRRKNEATEYNTKLVTMVENECNKNIFLADGLSSVVIVSPKNGRWHRNGALANWTKIESFTPTQVRLRV